MKHTRKRNGQRLPMVVIGCDSETLQGPPITFQFYTPNLKRFSGCVFIGKRDPTTVFIERLKRLPHGRYRMYGHNLEFDMLSFLWDARAKIRDGNIDLQIADWTISGRYSKPVFAVFDDGDRYIELVDSFLWFMTSLEKAAELVCPDLPKLLRPKGLGETLYTAKDTDFVEYAMRDAVVAYHLGEAIEKFHDELEVPPQISLASMAASVFRLRYMQNNIYQPPMYEWMIGAAASYHGGVNRVRPNAAPAWHLNVTALDISSAYPDAMSTFPPFDNPAAFKTYKRPKKFSYVPAQGIYLVSGTAANCDWPALFDHDFSALQGKFADTWVTGYELNAALEMDEVKLTRLSGYHYDADDWDYSPFTAYVDDFYRLKSDAKDPVMRYMYKILLNALTGKFIQTSPDFTLVDGQLVKVRRAGGLYHPFIASLITGHTRAAIHALEHKHAAIHTATDGIFVPGYIKGDRKKSLGAVCSEGFGDLALFRNKLYIFYSDASDEGGYSSQIFKGRNVLKCARHGFQGKVLDLERMLVSPNRTYKVNKPIKLKTALRQGENPNKFVTTERRLKITEPFKTFKYSGKRRR